jgi:hypothetical protein
LDDKSVGAAEEVIVVVDAVAVVAVERVDCSCCWSLYEIHVWTDSWMDNDKDEGGLMPMLDVTKKRKCIFFLMMLLLLVLLQFFE